jgi:hypothetical protein
MDEEDIEAAAALAPRGKLSDQEAGVVDRLAAQGRPTLAIAAVLDRNPGMVSDHINKVSRASTRPAPPQKFKIFVKNVPPPLFRLIVDCAARRRISAGEVMLRLARHVLTNGNPSAALDVYEHRADLK